MKKTEKLLSILLMLAMLITSAGLLYASIYASGSGSQSTFSAVVFEGETGIRYNNLTGEFEVFNEAGVSWIASDRFISVEGTIELTGADHASDSNWGKADGNKIYNIMRDIAYTGTKDNETHYNSAFNANKITLGQTGVLDGRGFYLKGFAVKAISVDSKTIGSAIVALNNGTIRNLNVSDASIAQDGSGEAAGIICGINKGQIDSCAVYGSYSASEYIGLYGVAAQSSGKITNTVNSANLTNNYSIATAYAAGIASIITNASSQAQPSLLNNTNNGNITVTNAGHAAGIAIETNGIMFIVRGNTNNAQISAQTAVSGIVDGGIDLANMTAKDNKNNGDFSGNGETNELYYTITYFIPEYGILWNESLNEGSGGFEIYNADGISWMCYGDLFDATGVKGQGQAADGNAYYEIYGAVKQIDFEKRSDKYNTRFDGGSAGDAPTLLAQGRLNGNNSTLKNFPLRQCGAGVTINVYYSTLFYRSDGIVEYLKIDVNAEAEVTSGGRPYAGALLGRTTGTEWRISFVEISGYMLFESNGFLGGIAGSWSVSTTVSHLNDCVVKASLGGSEYVGGFVGLGEARNIIRISFLGNIFNDGGKTLYAAGITGYSSRYSDCTGVVISGTINGKFTGFLIGYGDAYAGNYSLFISVGNALLEATLAGESLHVLVAGGDRIEYTEFNHKWHIGYYYLSGPA